MNKNEDPAVGSLAEEAAKLLTALTELAGDGGGAKPGEARSGLSDLLNQVSDHVGTGDDCTYCPLCRLINGVRATSPEVRHHLTAATSSLLQAVVGLLSEGSADKPRGQEPVEHIDLDGIWEDQS